MISSIGHTYLSTRNRATNGGLAATFLSQVQLKNVGNQLTVQMGSVDIGQYITGFFFNASTPVPYFDPTTGLITKYNSMPTSNIATSFFGLLFIFVPLVFGLFWSVSWVVWRILKTNPSVQIFLYQNNLFKKQKIHTNREISIFTKDEIQNKRKYFLNRNLMFSSICAILTIAYIISFTLSAASQTFLQNQFLSTNSNNSLVSSWQQVTQHIDSFFSLILLDSYQMFNSTLDTMSNSIQGLLTSSLNNVTSSLMNTFGVTGLFITLASLITNLNSTVNSMTYIKNYSQPVLSLLDQNKGILSVYQNALQSSISAVCSQISNNSTCAQYLQDISLLYVPITTIKINTESSVSMIFILQQFNFNLTQLSGQIKNLELQFNAQITALTNQKVNELNIGQSFTAISVVWNSLSGMILPAKSNFNLISNSISGYISSFVTIIIIISSLLLALIFFVACCYLLSNIRYAIIYYFERVILVDNMVNPPNRPIFILHHFKKQRVIYRLKDRLNVPYWTIYTYLLLFSFILVVLVIFSLLVAAVGELIYNETCNQFWNPNGLSNFDKILNSVLSNQWSSITMYIASLKAPIQINLVQPNQILENVVKNCTNNTGLLNVLQLTNMINVSSFLWSPQNLEALQSGLTLIYQSIIGIGTNNLMPPDMATFLSTASNITKYFDAIDYKVSINELNQTVVAISNFSQWLDSSITYFSTTNTQQTSSVLQQLKSVKALLPNLDNLQKSVNLLLSNYVNIQQRRVNNNLITQLLNGLTTIQNNFVPSNSTYDIVSQVYTEKMLKTFPILADNVLSIQLQKLLSVIFPCRDLSQAFVLLMSNTCNSSQLIEVFVSHGFIIAILSLFLILMFHFHWILIRIDFCDNVEKDISTC